MLLDHASLPVPLPHTIWYDDLTICPPLFPSPTHLHRYTLINLHGHPTFAHTPSLTHSLTHTHTPPIHTNNYTPCYPCSLCRKTKPILTRCHAPLYYVIVFNTSQFPYNQFLSLYKQRTQKNHTAFVCKERSKTNNSNCKSPPLFRFLTRTDLVLNSVLSIHSHWLVWRGIRIGHLKGSTGCRVVASLGQICTIQKMEGGEPCFVCGGHGMLSVYGIFTIPLWQRT